MPGCQTTIHYCYDIMRKSESIYDIFQEVFDFALNNMCQRFYLHLFNEVVSGENEKLLFTRS